MAGGGGGGEFRQNTTQLFIPPKKYFFFIFLDNVSEPGARLHVPSSEDETAGDGKPQGPGFLNKHIFIFEFGKLNVKKFPAQIVYPLSGDDVDLSPARERELLKMLEDFGKTIILNYFFGKKYFY